MQTRSRCLGALSVVFSSAALLLGQQLPVKESTGPDAWWPSRWGAADEAAASNEIVPAKVLEAARLITRGRIYRLGRVYEAGMPLFGARTWKLTIPGSPTSISPLGKNRLVYNDELLTAEIGQVGTQFDGPGHIGIAIGQGNDPANVRYYNGVTQLDIASPYGLKKLGVENVRPIVTRGVLIDMVAAKGRMLDKGEEITPKELREAMRREGVSELRAGDVVLIHTGWGSLWMKDNARFNSGAPGIGIAAAVWLADQGIVCIGSDTWSTEVVPNPDAALAFPVHGELIPKRGVFIHENLDFTELVRDKVYEFAYIFVPVPIKGATGSPGSPIAIR